MYCPKCGAHNLEEAQFCRSCGANLSLVPQALTGQLPAPVTQKAAASCTSDNNISGALRNIFMGIAFIAISLVLSFQGASWWFWMLIPALTMIGKGVGDYVQARSAMKMALPPSPATAPVLPPAQPRPMFGNQMAAPNFNTGEIRPPQNYSVTEGTTRHLTPEPPRSESKV